MSALGANSDENTLEAWFNQYLPKIQESTSNTAPVAAAAADYNQNAIPDSQADDSFEKFTANLPYTWHPESSSSSSSSPSSSSSSLSNEAIDCCITPLDTINENATTPKIPIPDATEELTKAPIRKRGINHPYNVVRPSKESIARLAASSKNLAVTLVPDSAKTATTSADPELEALETAIPATSTPTTAAAADKVGNEEEQAANRRGEFLPWMSYSNIDDPYYNSYFTILASLMH